MFKRSIPNTFHDSIIFKKIKTHDLINPITSVLSDENMLYEILKHVDSKTLGMASCVSKTWRKTSQNERLWEMICTQPSLNIGCSIDQLRLVVLALGGFNRLHSQYLLPLSKPSISVIKSSSSSTVAAATSSSVWPCLPTPPRTVVPGKRCNSVKTRWGKDEMQLSLSLLSIRYFENLDYNGRKK
ncbi:F-box protein GID2-like [Rutidosis leptorrhynchoides]|uniref:F-box protein GID2-like n=1 Tax=Rutidosis leptorrhynchoides TaxID=125765 RepID=UPI003A99D59E